MNDTLGIAHFLAHADFLTRGILILMLLASLGTWYLTTAKTLAFRRLHRGAREFLGYFDQVATLEGLGHGAPPAGLEGPFARVLQHGLAAVETLQAAPTGRGALNAGATQEEFLIRALKRGLDQERAGLAQGQNFLATVASTAPFVGLFGTVWGIYHALLAIGASGQGSLDQVAGPVGEALIMTAVGLGVAIPASVAYNHFVQRARGFQGDLTGFAHDVFCLLVTGVKPRHPAGAHRETLRPDRALINPASAD